MNYFDSIILGIVQGLTEFLPVSSSGHLVLVQKLLPGFSEPGVVFESFLHLGTLLAVVIYFRKKLVSIVSDYQYIFLLIVGTIPAVIVGVLFRDFLENSFNHGGIALAVQFFITSMICFLTDKYTGNKKEISVSDAGLIGTAQAFAILPAISRSGATIFMSVLRGIGKKEAAEFSFLLSVPAILGANILELYSYKDSIFPFDPAYFPGFIASTVMGLVSIYLTIRLLNQGFFKAFGIYTAVVGIFAILIK